jgi:hypothetical protein
MVCHMTLHYRSHMKHRQAVVVPLRLSSCGSLRASVYKICHMGTSVTMSRVQVQFMC